MSVRVQTPSGPTVNANLEGYSVGDLRGNTDLQAAFSTNGDETVQVRSAGDTEFVTVDDNYVLDTDDVVRFVKAAGTKG